jgi:hypothetical protein
MSQKTAFGVMQRSFAGFHRGFAPGDKPSEAQNVRLPTFDIAVSRGAHAAAAKQLPAQLTIAQQSDPCDSGRGR